MKNMYVFSGLGVDKRVFQKINFGDHHVTHINWIKPIKNESIEAYAKRLTSQIKDANPILMGLPFGGIMAIEVAKLIPTEKIILIASAKTKKEIPFYYRLAGKLKIHKILPSGILMKPNIFANWFLGVKEAHAKKILAAILHDTDKDFFNWAIDKIVNWQNTTLHSNLKHIHGTSDRLLPYRFITCDITIPNGGHFMTVNKANELSEKIQGLLQ